MAQIIVGVADMRVTTKPDDIVITYSLGSCIGLVAYDPEVPVGGILHFMLPRSNIDSKKAEQNPYMFGDVGIPKFFKKMFDMGAEKKRIVVKLAGGAQILGDGAMFNIGKRNHTIARKLLWKNNILIAAEDVGGSLARTLKINVADGSTFIRSSGQEVEI